MSSPLRHMRVRARDLVSTELTKRQDEKIEDNLPALPLCSTKSPDAGCESTRGTERRRTARCPGTNQVHQGVGPTASMYKQYQARKARAAPVAGTAKLQDDGMPFQTRSQNGEKPAERERKPHGGVAAADTGEKA